MVQLKCNLPLPFTDRPDNTYWAIGDEASQVDHKKNHFVDYSPNPISGDEMINRANRKERGLLAYENCRVAELKAFIKARKLKVSKVSSAKKADLIAALQKADDEVVFSKMLDFPPEIRKMICEDQLRLESRPIYVRDSTFVLSFRTTAGKQQVMTGTIPLRTTVIPETATMLQHLSDEDVSRIRHIDLRLFKPTDRGGHWRIASWIVDLNCYGGPELVPTDDMNAWTTHWYWANFLDKINAGILEALMKIWNRAGVHKLRRTDIEVLRQAMHAALL